MNIFNFNYIGIFIILSWCMFDWILSSVDRTLDPKGHFWFIATTLLAIGVTFIFIR